MIRRFALASCAFLATAALVSCSSTNDNDVAARVGDIELTQDQLDDLVTGGSDTTSASDPADSSVDTVTDATSPETLAGDDVRAALTQWIKVAIVESSLEGHKAEDISSTENLSQRLEDGLNALAAAHPENARAMYEDGVPESSSVCLGAIPVATAEDGEKVISEIEGGMTFEDAASQYSTDATLASNGGVITNNNQECFFGSTLNPEILVALDGLSTGTPVVLELDTLTAVIQMRPFDSLSDDAKLEVAQYSVAAEVLPGLVDGAKVFVDARYGYWDVKAGKVLPLNVPDTTPDTAPETTGG